MKQNALQRVVTKKYYTHPLGNQSIEHLKYHYIPPYQLKCACLYKGKKPECSENGHWLKKIQNVWLLANGMKKKGMGYMKYMKYTILETEAIDSTRRPDDPPPLVTASQGGWKPLFFKSNRK